MTITALLLVSESEATEEIVSIQMTVDPEAIESLEQKPMCEVPVIVRLQGKSIANCTVHLKGHGSFQPISGKPSFSIHSSKRDLFGRKRLLLNNSSQDPSFLKWKIASEPFMKAGVPAPEVGFARVSLNGQMSRLYLMVEPTDKKFLKKYFSDANGNLYEGDNQDVTDTLDKDNGDGGDAQTDRHQLATACLERDLQKRWSLLNQVLDVDRFLSFMAVEVLVDHRDGYSMDRNHSGFTTTPVTTNLCFSRTFADSQSRFLNVPCP